MAQHDTHQHFETIFKFIFNEVKAFLRFSLIDCVDGVVRFGRRVVFLNGCLYGRREW
jgi:hypothetical protein